MICILPLRTIVTSSKDGVWWFGPTAGATMCATDRSAWPVDAFAMNSSINYRLGTGMRTGLSPIVYFIVSILVDVE